MGLAGLFAAGCMLFSCSSEVKEANYQIIPIPQEIVMGQDGAFALANGTKVMYPEGNEKMQTLQRAPIKSPFPSAEASRFWCF